MSATTYTTYTACVSCGEEASGRHALPVDNEGDIVSTEYGGAWSGMPACERCSTIHAAIGDATGKADERNPGATVRAVLAAHVAATRELRRYLTQARFDFNLIAGVVRETLDTIGDNPSALFGILYDNTPAPPVVLNELVPPSVFKAGAGVRVGEHFYRRELDRWVKLPGSAY
jgi:hypothetical protein